MRLFAPLLLPAMLLIACGDSPLGTIPTNIVFPVSNVSYSGHVQPLFDASCSQSGCHNEFDQAGDLSLRSYFDLFRRSGIVRPGDSTNSILSQVLSGRLPHHAATLTLYTNENQRRGVNTWVAEGASNN